MLLAVTPSILDRLGIRTADLNELGTAKLSSSELGFLSDTVKVVSLSPTSTTIGDSNGDLLSAEAMAQKMQCSRANVYEREKKGSLFSVLPPGRENGRRYPAFQLQARLDAALLTALIMRFRERQASMNLLWDFLRSVQPSLGGLTGVELLLWQVPQRRGVDHVVLNELNLLDAAVRREYVIDHALEGLSYALS
ncbi:hypothetical protein [Acidovorax sp. Root219]|uniref:hypothetical protein n=1 Tax=Acidovorax sp. Root219 TaxID=1736493 RepID=UPI000712E973|nr:hypothetical protein [Acidovorax sp. Root219]KRC30730.1 hypothetical protein ASE28_13365 [Acidovorax sp. Root219]